MEESIPSDSGFVVEWQLAGDADSVIDLAVVEAKARRSELVTVPPSSRVPTAR